MAALTLADLDEPPAGVDYARPGDLVTIDDEDGEPVVVAEVIAAWTRGEAEA